MRKSLPTKESEIGSSPTARKRFARKKKSPLLTEPMTSSSTARTDSSACLDLLLRLDPSSPGSSIRLSIPIPTLLLAWIFDSPLHPESSSSLDLRHGLGALPPPLNRNSRCSNSSPRLGLELKNYTKSVSSSVWNLLRDQLQLAAQSFRFAHISHMFFCLFSVIEVDGHRSSVFALCLSLFIVGCSTYI